MTIDSARRIHRLQSPPVALSKQLHQFYSKTAEIAIIFRPGITYIYLCVEHQQPNLFTTLLLPIQ